MCNYSSEKSTLYESLCSTFGLPWPLAKKHHKHLHLGLLKRKRAQLKDARQRRIMKLVVMKAEIEMKNLKLYMENQIILEENERLRKKALLLHEENQALLSQLQKKLSEQSEAKPS